MAGEDDIDKVKTYLSRLMGEAISADHPVRMRSVHRAAFTSWARKQNPPIHFSGIASDKPFTIRQILQADSPDVVRFPVANGVAMVSHSAAAAADTIGQVVGIGIDIEEVDALPQADDYREHAFFRDNFTPAEIAYCLRQADVRASLCGTWAAKEAVLKAGIGPVTDLKSIEIKRDALGRPTVPGCSVSISHTKRTAVAVCVVSAVAAAPREAPSVPAVKTTPAPVGMAFKKRGLASIFAAVAGSALTLALYAWPSSHQIMDDVTAGHGSAGHLAKPG
jgi:phosphopantetheine--protein transferase-like protein